MAHYVFIIGSDDTVHRGEVANTVSLSQPLVGRADLCVHTFKVSQTGRLVNQDKPSAITIDAAKNYIDEVPTYHPDLFTPLLAQINPNDSVVVLGGGHSTLRTIAAITDTLRAQQLSVKTGWTTHMVEQECEIDILADHNIALFAPLWTEDAVRRMPRGTEVTMVGVFGMPTGNDLVSLQHDRDRLYQYNPVAQAFQAYAYPAQGEPQPYIGVMANAGFNDEHGVFNVIEPAEAYQQGLLVGASVPANLALLYVHGGPRNLQNERVLKERGVPEMPTDAFIRGYTEGQGNKGGQPRIFIDRFIPSTEIPVERRTNSVNVLIAMSHDPNCWQVILPDEGEGTKSDALMYGCPGKFSLLPSSLVDRDPTGQRQASRRFYQEQGMTVLQPGTAVPLVTETTVTHVSFDQNNLPGVVCLRYFGLIT